MKKTILLSVFFFVSFCKIKSQNTTVISDYINTYKQIAITEMQRTGVPAAITLAQGIHETGAGTSPLVLKSNNHFGIKCKADWTGESVSYTDDAPNECFRKYTDPAESYKDHSDFLKNGQRYAFLFSLDPTDYEGWANGLKKAGYATNPRYAPMLIKLIEDHHLQDYTLIAMGKMQDDNMAVVKNSDEEKRETVKAIVKEEVVTKGIKYPEGEFKINDTKVIFVEKGVSFLSIASQYNIPLVRLFDFNDLAQAEETENDQLIFLQRKRKTGVNEFYIVQPGETLFDIAQKQAIRLEALIELNWLNENDKPAPGEQLSLWKRSATIPKLVVKENYLLGK